jgi:hypothetical protein
MKLSFKDIKFIIQAIDNLIETYEECLNGDKLEEDEISDLGNDCMFLEALRTDLAKSLEQSFSHIPNNVYSNPQISVQELMQPVSQLPISQRLFLVDMITESIRQELSLSKS